MNLDNIEKLVKLIEGSSLMEFSYKEGDVKIEMSKLDNPPVVVQGAPSDSSSITQSSGKEEAEEEPLFITSPIVGTFYSAAAPDVPAYVRVGDKVKSGETVCILEAMKMMNKIQAEWDCEIQAVLVSNEQKVEYGQPLFRVKRL